MPGRELWLKLDLNPEPWRIGPVGYSRRNGRMSAYVGQDAQLNAYKNAVREEVEAQLPADFVMFDGRVTLECYFWRQRIEYTTHQARTHRKHEADGTNLMKATEDALQGVIYKNDKDNARGVWEIVAQGPDVEPAIIVHVTEYEPTFLWSY